MQRRHREVLPGYSYQQPGYLRSKAIRGDSGRGLIQIQII